MIRAYVLKMIKNLDTIHKNSYNCVNQPKNLFAIVPETCIPNTYI